MQDKAISIHKRKYKMRSKNVEVENIVDRQLTSKRELNPVTKRMQLKSEFIENDNKKRMSKFRCSDFALENQIAIGAELKPCKLSGSLFGNISAMTAAIEKISQTETKTE